MVTATTQGIKISVEIFFQPGYAAKDEYFFAYRITIENKSEHSIKLLRRHWHIYDAVNIWKEVEGEGVVGEQPLIEPGGMHQYVSGCNLQSPAGKMFGTYLMERQNDAFAFTVNIPQFEMIAPFLLN